MMSLLKQSLLTTFVVATMATVSCQQAAPPQPPPQTPAAPAVVHQENGRYQIVIGNEGDRGAVLFLLDTRDGGTWIYRPPSPPAFNGFWSDIPRLTYPPETWQQVFQAMAQQAGQQPRPPAPSGTITPERAPAPSR